MSNGKKDRLEELESVLVAAEKYIRAADEWANTSNPIEVQPLTGLPVYRRTPELGQRDLRYFELRETVKRVRANS